MITLKHVAQFINGTVIGDENLIVTGMTSCDLAKEGDITFAMDGKDLERVKSSKAGCVLTSTDVENYPKTILKVKDMKLAMTMMYNAMLELMPPEKGVVHATAVIGENVKLGNNVAVGAYAVIDKGSEIGDDAKIGPHCYIGKNVRIGKGTRLFAKVTVYDNTVIGNRGVIHAGVVIGADGFGFIPQGGKIYKVPQMGQVMIGDNVEIGANACIDRGTFANTIIGDNVKIDNLVQIAHNVKVERNVMIAALTGIAGSCTIGEGTLLGGMVGVSDHVSVGKNVKAGAKTGIHNDVEDNKIVFGYPSREASEARKLHGLLSLIIRNERKVKKLLREESLE
ncbi:MAG: UDP-3-O-(3-hydroxymyristoyl)glucosamine N-acyltransferase [Candidatus Omnitrophica bacterium]|nr:UDP-3-O-(3-hydroxymyristoyl)glucosamine N-acyltransferase [Candidatus Omnitrophota bacterium]